MFKKIIIAIVVVFSLVSLVFAAGGGGGGGGSSGGSSGITPYSNLKCSDSGVLSFSRGIQLETVAVIAENETIIPVPGSWENGKFTSEEAVLVKAGTYTINDPTYGIKTVICPGLTFSCKLAQMELQECSVQDQTVSVKFTLNGVETKAIKLQFAQSGGRALTYQEGSFSTELKGLTIQHISGTQFQATAAVSDITAVQLSIPQCIGRYYKYSTIDCASPPIEQKEEIPGSKLKCGGYLDIKDRVQCRLSLREEERSEYENFFPEECKTRSDAEHCLEIYQAVQQCWDFPNGQARINCVQRVLKLGAILTEKANCNALDAGKRENCNQELKDKVYALVKFRLYNLEEEAEQLMEQGLLTQDQVAEFVVKMEQHKAAFNAVTTTEERRGIILQARQNWLELMKSLQKVES